MRYRQGLLRFGDLFLLELADRPFYLYDTFGPTVPDEEGSQRDGTVLLPYLASGPDAVAQNFAEWPGVRLVVGRIPDTLDDVGPVAFLHVDLNPAKAESDAIRHFWPRLSHGAPMILDDYGRSGFETQRVAADEVGLELGFEILALPTGQGLGFRRTVTSGDDR